MTGRRWHPGRFGLLILMFVWLAVLMPISVAAAPYAAMVMDARNGKVLHARNADTRLHPASLTKMMTLYIAFEAVENGELTMDTLITVSRKAAAEEPSKLGLRAGQKIKLRYLVRAAAIKSANDAATAIAEGIEGSEAAFARRMNRTAKAMGMTRTTFKNAHGLTETGHLSTARDMTILGRHMIYDYSAYYNLFSRKTADAGVRRVSHTNTRLLNSYRGADGIKTGYTRAAGYNLVASAHRGNKRVIATVFGGRSTVSRNARVAELLDLGFKKSAGWGNKRKPKKPPYLGKGAPAAALVAKNAPAPAPGSRAKSIRVASAAVKRSLRPVARPGSVATPVTVAPIVASLGKEIEKELQVAVQASDTSPDDKRLAAPSASKKPVSRPAAAAATLAYKDKPTPGRDAEVITRLSTSGGRHWGINLGRFPSENAAQKVLLKTALAETATLGDTRRKIVRGKTGFDALFTGMTRDGAELACRRLQARQMTCFMVGPS